MFNRFPSLLFVFFISIYGLQAQSVFDFSSEEVESRLKQDVYTLASEEMEGRESGTPGEERAAWYIKEAMRDAGLSPVFGDSFLQTFEFSGPWSHGPDNFFIMNDQEFTLDEDFFVLPNSSSQTLRAEAVYVSFGVQNDLQDDYAGLSNLEGKIFFMEYFLPEYADDPSGPQPRDVLFEKIELAKNKGAAAIAFVNTRSWRNNPNTRLTQNLGSAEIPIFFVRDEVFEYWQQLGQGELLFVSADLQREIFTGLNVAGYWDNNADHTVVIGGHFDHLGYGGNSSRSPGVKEIHYGADDNASGVAGVLEAARYLPVSDHSGNNYLFIAFGAEEKGLIGSRHFTNSDAYDMGKVNYMFNLDMIGRKNNNQLTLFGTGTSPVWETTIDENAKDLLNVRKSISGMGGSDHTNFYLKDIPVLFFFTGIHDDYHRPTDTPDLVNYKGMQKILNFAYGMIEDLDGTGKLEFTPTPVTRQRSQRRGAGVTLGLMPDHAYEGQGLKVLAVVEDRPAKTSGIKDGDVIVQIGSDEITDVHSYMQVLGNLRPDQTVEVRVMRNNSVVSLEVKL